MSNQLLIRLIPYAMVLLVGCTASKAIRDQAIALDHEILTFRDAQQARVDKLNQDFREISDQLLAKLQDLGEQQLSFDRDHDAQAFADDFAGDNDASSLPGKFADRLLETVARQRQRLLNVDAQIQKARNNYADNYQTLKLSMNKLTDLHNQLKALAAPDTGPDLLAIVVKDVQAAYNGVKDAQKQVASEQQSTATKK